MSSLFDALEDQLRDAAHARVAARRRRSRWGWLRAGGRLVPLAAGVAAAAAILVAALVLLHAGPTGGRSSPAAPPAAMPPASGVDPAYRDLDRLTDRVRHSSVCVPDTFGGSVPGLPSAAVRGELAILNRPAAVGDDVLSSMAAQELPGPPYRHDIRRARIVDGTSFDIVPVLALPSSSQPSAACLAAQRAAIRSGIGGVPRGMRASVIAAARSALSPGIHLQPLNRPTDEVCLVWSGRASSQVACDELSAAALRRPTPPEVVIVAPPLGTIFAEIVPDGVTSVTLRVPATAGQPARTLTGDVRGNVAVIRTPGENFSVSRETVIWSGPLGREVFATD